MFIFIYFCRAPKRARKWTQILAVVAVSIGAFIHGTTVTFPAVAIPSIKASNNSDNISAVDAFMPFHVYENDISLIGKTPLHKGLFLNYVMGGFNDFGNFKYFDDFGLKIF